MKELINRISGGSTNMLIALDELCKATTVQEWNLARKNCKGFLSVADLGVIDSCGLIVKILGRDLANG